MLIAMVSAAEFLEEDKIKIPPLVLSSRAIEYAQKREAIIMDYNSDYKMMKKLGSPDPKLISDYRRQLVELAEEYDLNNLFRLEVKQKKKLEESVEENVEEREEQLVAVCN